MRAVVRRGSQLEIDKNYALPEPGPGQMIVKTLCCGICGSDLHALHHMDHFAAIGQRSGALRNLQASHDLVFGHEFCAEIVDYGPGCSKTLKPGQNVVSMPYAAGSDGLEVVGYSNTFARNISGGSFWLDKAREIQLFNIFVQSLFRKRTQKIKRKIMETINVSGRTSQNSARSTCLHHGGERRDSHLRRVGGAF